MCSKLQLQRWWFFDLAGICVDTYSWMAGINKCSTNCACHNLVFCRWPAAVRNIQCVLCDVTWLFDFDFQKSAGSAHSTPVKAPRTPSKGSATAPSTPRKDKSDGGGGDKNSTTPSAKTPTAGRNKVLPKEVMNWARASFTRCSWVRLLYICCLQRSVEITTFFYVKKACLKV